MTAVPLLRCIAGAYEGRELPLEVGKPLRLPVKAKDGSEGELRISATEAGWQLVNDSRVSSLVNGIDQREVLLADGDQFRVGKMVFEVHLGESKATGPGSMRLEQVPRDRSDTVVMKTPPAKAPAEDESDTGTAPLDAEVIEDDSGDGEDPARSKDSGRLRRRISASRPSITGDMTPKRNSLLRRMSQALRIRGGSRREYFKNLSKDRDLLLREFGRRALEQYGGMGLPDDFLRRLSAGERIDIAADDLGEGDLELFRRCRQRLAQLDAEIEALRHELSLDDEVEEEGGMLQMLSDESLEERVYATMDGVGTEAIPEDLEVEEVAEDAAEVEDSKRSSGNRRRGRRRRKS